MKKNITFITLSLFFLSIFAQENSFFDTSENKTAIRPFSNQSHSRSLRSDDKTTFLAEGESVVLEAEYSGTESITTEWYDEKEELLNVSSSNKFQIKNKPEDPKGVRTYKSIVKENVSGKTFEQFYKVEFYLDSETVVVQQDLYMFFVSNNKKTNGGYEFSSYKWLLLDTLDGPARIAPGTSTLQAYTPDEYKKTTLDSLVYYQVELHTVDGKVLRTEPFKAKLTTPYNFQIKLYPNPVISSERITVENNLPSEYHDGRSSIEVYNSSGVLEKRLEVRGSATTFDIYLQGVYYVCFKSIYFMESKILIVI